MLGNASKVDFTVKPQIRRANLIKPSNAKKPAKNKQCDNIKKILDNFKKELYNQEHPKFALNTKPRKMSSFNFASHRSSNLQFSRTTG